MVPSTTSAGGCLPLFGRFRGVGWEEAPKPRFPTPLSGAGHHHWADGNDGRCAIKVRAPGHSLLTESKDEQGRRQRFEEYALLHVLRQEPARSAQADCRSDLVNLRRMRRT